MSERKKLYLFIGIVILLAIIWSFGVAYIGRKPQMAFAHMPFSPVVDELTAIGINLPPGETITAEDIQEGKYPLEAMNIGNNNFVLDVAHRYGRFWRFDSNQDGIIDDKDPIFDQLAVGIIDPETNTIRFVSWKDFGLRALIPDPAHLTREKATGELPSGFWTMHSTVVTADNFKWLTFHVPVPTKFIDSLKTSDPNQRLVETVR